MATFCIHVVCIHNVSKMSFVCGNVHNNDSNNDSNGCALSRVTLIAVSALSLKMKGCY